MKRIEAATGFFIKGLSASAHKPDSVTQAPSNAANRAEISNDAHAAQKPRDSL